MHKMKYIIRRVDGASGDEFFYGPFDSPEAAWEWVDEELGVHLTHSTFTLLTIRVAS